MGTTVSDPEFEALLDKMAEEMESEEDDTPVNRHKWETERAVLFDCDDYKYQCGKCAVKLTVRKDQSILSAMEEHGVLEDCAEQLVRDMESF